MKRVQLVVTGKCEQALHESVRQIFPSLEWPSPVLADAFTSTSLEGPVPPRLTQTIDKFAFRLAELVDSHDECLVIGVDDLEENSPLDVANALRASIPRVLNDDRIARSGQRRARVEQKLSERCSFHLLRPMVESYFFRDPAALKRAGAVRQSRFDAEACDCELFDVVDDDFLLPPDTEDKQDWRRGGAARRRHPKRYLKFLTSDAAGVWTYAESRDGRAALRSIDWAAVVANPRHVAAVRALLNDIADFEQSESRVGDELAETSRSTMRVRRVLRNL